MKSNNNMFYGQKLIEQLATNAETFGSTRLTEDLRKRLDTWEMTPEEEFYEAVYLHENFGVDLPQEMNEAYKKLLEDDTATSDEEVPGEEPSEIK